MSCDILCYVHMELNMHRVTVLEDTLAHHEKLSLLDWHIQQERLAFRTRDRNCRKIFSSFIHRLLASLHTCSLTSLYLPSYT